MKELIEFISQKLVDDPTNVSVTEVDRNHTTLLELRVSKLDVGKVIGKKGRTAQALRTILHAASVSRNKPATLEIIE